jgi:oligopeptide/dipeptide ABC transporter ATP-binding protein
LKTYLFTSLGNVKAVDGVSLKVGEGEAVGLVGESGCGKTMTARSIIRLIPTPPGRIVGGRIIFKGRDLLKLTKNELNKMRGKEIGMVFQDPMTFLNPVLKIGDQIAEVLLAHQVATKNDARRKVVEILEKMRMPSASKVVDYYPHMLSGGMRQRVLIAIGICCDPSLVILDEPTSALDATVQAQVLALIKSLKSDFNVSLLLITHDLGIVSDICDRVYVMYAGKIVEHADVYSIFENPLHPYTAGLLNCVLSIDEYKESLFTIPGSVPDMINLPSGCRFHPRCSQSMLVCTEKEPSPIKHNPGHVVSCWLYR